MKGRKQNYISKQKVPGEKTTSKYVSEQLLKVISSFNMLDHSRHLHPFQHLGTKVS